MVAAAGRTSGSGEVATQMSGAKHRIKGTRIEREIVSLHEELGIHAERVPLSGASRYQDNGADVDVYPFGVDECPFVFEVKARKTGDGFRLLERWIEGAEGLFLRSDRRQPLVVLPWATWVRLLEEINRWQHVAKKQRLAATLGKLGLAEEENNARTKEIDNGSQTGASQKGAGTGLAACSTRPASRKTKINIKGE